MGLFSKVFIDRDDRDPKSTVLISGMGRSGTTWLADIINYDHAYRDIFEPFLPEKVAAAKPFVRNQYIRPTTSTADLVHHAKRILAGKVRSRWTDSANMRFVSSRRIIKDIRTNLMLKWLLRIRPGMPILLIIRHPLAVVRSWTGLDWGQPRAGTAGDFKEVVSQRELLEDFPLVSHNLKYINQSDYFEHLVFLWCILYYVPMNQLRADEFLLVSYEELVLRSEMQIPRIFSFVGRTYDENRVLAGLRSPSRTSYQRNPPLDDRLSRIRAWKEAYRAEEIERAVEILGMFGMEKLYREDGQPSGLAELRGFTGGGKAWKDGELED